MKKIPIIKRITGKGYITTAYSLVDDEDYEELSKYRWFFRGGCKKYGYYVGTRINKKIVYMHILLMGKSNFYIDHKNRDKSDNRRCNLRFCTMSQNIANSNKAHGVSKYRGVWYRPDPRRIKRWSSEIKVKGKKMSLGVYFTEEEAAIAYNVQCLESFGEFATLNIIK